MPPVETWAKVRAVDPAVESPVCQHCPTLAVLAFRAEYSMAGVVMEPGEVLPSPERAELRTREMVIDAYACMEHAGQLAYAAAVKMLQGPFGGV